MAVESCFEMNFFYVSDYQKTVFSEFRKNLQESWKERFTISDYLGLYHPFLIPLKIFPTSFPCFPRIDSLEKSSRDLTQVVSSIPYIFLNVFTNLRVLSLYFCTKFETFEKFYLHPQKRYTRKFSQAGASNLAFKQIFDLVRYDNVTRFRSIPFSNRGGGEYRSTVGCQEVHSEIKTTSVRPLPGDFNCG